MLLDGFTVGAQLVNFLLLVWLLKRFLYRPILDAIATREQRIAAQLQDAEQQKAAARLEREDFQHKNEVFNEERESLVRKMTAEVKLERLRLLEEARTAAATLRDGFTEKLKQEWQAWQREIIQRTQREVFAMTRRTLQDLANANLEDQILAVLIRRLHELDPAEKAKLSTLSDAAAHPVQVRSGTELNPVQRDLIQAAFAETLGIQSVPRFETVPENLCGIEIVFDGHKISWSVADYLATLEQSLRELVPEPSPSNMEQHALPATV
ncbi:MAG: synthase chain [Planctomycetaceae bacterium]|nr:synthase chain [Planctomycetaceae bacterium]